MHIVTLCKKCKVIVPYIAETDERFVARCRGCRTEYVFAHPRARMICMNMLESAVTYAQRRIALKAFRRCSGQVH